MQLTDWGFELSVKPGVSKEMYQLVLVNDNGTQYSCHKFYNSLHTPRPSTPIAKGCDWDYLWTM